MKNKVIPHRPNAVSKSTVAKHYNVNGGSVTAWVKAGCPQLPNGQFVMADVERWLQKRQAGKEERASLKDQKTQAEIDRIQRDISKRDLELAQQRGEVHGKAECCKSLTSVVSEALQPLLSVGSRLGAQFPELGQRLRDAADKEIDAAMAQIREGLNG